MRSFFSQANLIKAAVIVAVLMFAAPMLLAQPAVQRLAPGRVGAFAVNLLGVLAALFLVRQTGVASK